MLKIVAFGFLVAVTGQEHLALKETVKTLEQGAPAPEIKKPVRKKDLLDAAAPFLDPAEVTNLREKLRGLNIEIFLVYREAYAALAINNLGRFWQASARLREIARKKSGIERYLQGVIKQRGRYVFRKVVAPEPEQEAETLDDEALFQKASRFLQSPEQAIIYFRLQALEERMFLSLAYATNAMHSGNWDRLFQNLFIQNKLRREKRIIRDYLIHVVTSGKKLDSDNNSQSQ